MLEESLYIWQWVLVIGSSLLLFFISPYAKSKNDFFKGSKLDKTPGFWLLTSSLVISWIFAKSITNAGNLGLSYGIVGGISYGAYYLSFLVAGFIIYYMRTRGNFRSIHGFLESKFGHNSLIVFSILIAFRLLNEVWSNTMVIGSYFGEAQSTSYYLAIIVFTLLTLAYTIKGGLRSSLLTDAIQMILFGLLLIVILGMLLPKAEMKLTAVLSSGTWNGEGGIFLLYVALLQVFSYPFHDPVMTDRAFIAPPKLTLKSFLAATIIGGLSIVLFSFIGIYGNFVGISGQAPVEVSKLLGPIMMLLVNFIMITSAASTLDSAFNSFSKLAIIDLKIFKNQSISNGRIMIIIACLLGTIPIFLNADILSATTISGTMVIGLTPIFAMWFLDAPKLSFYLSIFIGIVVGVLHVMGFDFPLFNFIGPYAGLLEANIWGIVLSFIGYFIPFVFIKFIPAR